ncbi:uncharacterized protein [Argopecten irradians]|uniref:uncharacterized protein n=1 Tax=Argopecten irradians TaxID=31199 RepID=UPI00371D3ED2
MFWKRKRPERGLKALAEGGLAFARTYSNILAQTEEKLDHAISRENRKPKSTIGKVRMKGEQVLHSKQVLLCIVFLNILDCILVLGELILDIYILKGVLEKAEKNELNFIINMKQIYPDYLAPLENTDVKELYRAILDADVQWGQGSHHQHGTTHNPGNLTTTGLNGISAETTTTSYNTTFMDTTTTSQNTTSVRRKRASGTGTPSNALTIHGNGTDHHDDHDHAHTIEEDLAHGFHKASIAILAVLVVETFLKVFFLGKELLERKLEMFDGFVVIASFIVDIVFLKGMSGMHVREMVVILAFLVPWRVIRVVNSLVVAVIDHEHFRMKLLYKQKKAVSNDLKKAKAENKSLTNGLEIVKKLAVGAGLSEEDIDKRLAIVNISAGGNKKKKGSSMSSFQSVLGGNKKKTTSVSSEHKVSIPSIQESVVNQAFTNPEDDTKT